MCTRKVGSSFWKRLSAREKFGVSSPSGLMLSEMTGSGTNMDVCLKRASRQSNRLGNRGHTMEREEFPSVKVSPEEHSTPKMAQISPGPISSMSWKCKLCEQVVRRPDYREGGGGEDYIDTSISEVDIPPCHHCASLQASAL